MNDPASDETGPLWLGHRDGLVERTRLVEALRGAADVPVVLVMAGAGYGKTTLLAQWLSREERPVAWLSLTRRHDDPVVLLAEIVELLDGVEALPPKAKRELAAVTVDFTSVLLPRLERVMAQRTCPFVLVLDDVHRLRRRQAVEVVGTLAACATPTRQLVLSSRTEPEVGVGRLRADRRLFEVTTTDLPLDRAEAATLLALAGVDLPARSVDRLWQRTEGWPVGLYLAARAVADEPDAVAAADGFAGDDRLVTEYVRDALLAVLTRSIRDFMLQVSVLDDLTAGACDTLLQRDDSAMVLAEAARASQLLVPLDRRGEAYRMHQLLRDALRAELARWDPALERELHQRAAAWYELSGDADRAVDHLLAAGDAAGVESIIWRATPLVVGAGRTATVERWLERFSHDQVAARPALAVARAWSALTSGDMSSLRYWSGVTSAFAPGGELPDGTPIAAAAALLRATVGADGVEQVRADAALAYDLDRQGSPYRGVARYIEGAALRLQGRRAEARERLEEGEVISSAGVPASQAHCVAQLAACAIDRDDWDTATRFVERFDAIVERFDLHERPAMGHSFAITALVRARAGNASDARAQAKHALFLVSMLATVAPWLGIEARIFLARTFLVLGDVAQARVLAREAAEMLALVPDGDALRARVLDVQLAAEAEHPPVGALPTPMTPAELRVLRYLPTHLTFAQIADELFVSRNTVKTQAISIYRKLGVSSRDPAVGAARALGLLES